MPILRARWGQRPPLSGRIVTLEPPETRSVGKESGGQTGAHEKRSEYGASELKAMCWCQAKTLLVPVEMIRRAETLSCGLDGCGKDDE